MLRAHITLALLVPCALASCASDVEGPAPSREASSAVQGTPAPENQPKPAHAASDTEAAARGGNETDEGLRFASLVPSGSFAWVRAESLEEMVQLGNEILFVAGVSDMEVDDLIAMSPVAGVVEHIDRDRPVGLAIGFAPGTTEPESTLILPVNDRGAVIQAFRSMNEAPEVFGIDDYVVATTLPRYSPGKGAPALTDGLPEGQLVARFDVPAFVDATGEMLELALWQLKLEADMPEDAGGPATDFEAQMRNSIVDALTTAVESAASLDVALSMEGSEIDLSLTFVAAEDSALDGLLPESSADLRPLADLIGEGDTISVVAGVDGDTVRDHLAPLWATAIEAAPVDSEMQAASLAWAQNFADVWPLMGDAVVGSGEARMGAFHFTYFFRPTDREAFLSEFQEVLAGLGAVTPSLTVLGPVQNEGVTQYLFTVSEAAEGINLADLSRREEELQRMFGTTQVPLRLAEHDGTTVLVIGGDDELLDRALARIGSGGGGPSSSMAAALDRVGHSNPAFVAEIDFAGITRDFLSMVEDRVGTDVGLDVPADAEPLPVVYYGGVEGLVWRLGFRTNFRRFGEMVQRSR